MRFTRTSRIALGLGAAAAGCLAYAAGYEVRSFRLRQVEVPVLAPGSRPLRVLQISDLHQVPGQRRKRDFVRQLDTLRPDLVVNTGDSMAHPDAVPYVMDALGPLLRRPGVFVFGSNDYYAPQLKNPARYLLPDDRPREHGPALPWKELREGLREAGWLDVSNAREALSVDGRRIAFVGVDDPHIEADDYSAVAGPPDPDADVAIGVMHAPYQRVLDAMHGDGHRLLLAGHTHGGQLCVPGWGALVTNCDLDTRRAKGLSRHPAGGGQDASWLHVSAGLGTSPYAPVRFACPPEATLLTLTGADGWQGPGRRY